MADPSSPPQYLQGIYRDIASPGEFAATVDERANLLRMVSKRLLHRNLDRESRHILIEQLAHDFAIELSDHGIDHFLGP